MSNFVVCGPYDEDMPNYYMTTTNLTWLVANMEILQDWLQHQEFYGNWQFSGAVVEFSDARDAEFFLIKWN